MAVIDGKIILTKNDCYKTYQKMTPKGIVVHSTGANNPYIKRYVAPDDGVIGKNDYGNDWNRGGLDVCVHGFLGYDKNKKVRFYQTLPFDCCCWGVGSGSKGSYNYNPAYIQFEICEDDLSSKSYCTNTYNKAVEVCAYLCEKYGIKVDNIVGHYEAYQKGYGSNHADPKHWWGKHGYTMSGFRKDVKAKMAKKPTTKTEQKVSPVGMFRVGTAWKNGKCVNQKGAFLILANAKKTCNEYAGYFVFNSKGVKVHSSTKKTPTIKAGLKLSLKNVPLYASSSATSKANTITGTYYLWDATKINNRYRITNSASNVGKINQVTGWIDSKYVK
jgi:hypothetical protein